MRTQGLILLLKVCCSDPELIYQFLARRSPGLVISISMQVLESKVSLMFALAEQGHCLNAGVIHRAIIGDWSIVLLHSWIVLNRNQYVLSMGDSRAINDYGYRGAYVG